MFASVGVLDVSTVRLLDIHLIISHAGTHNCQDKRQKTGQLRRCDGAFDEICKFHIRMNSDSPFQETAGVIHGAQITHTLAKLASPHLHVRPSVLLQQRVTCEAIWGGTRLLYLHKAPPLIRSCPVLR